MSTKSRTRKLLTIRPPNSRDLSADPLSYTTAAITVPLERASVKETSK